MHARSLIAMLCSISEMSASTLRELAGMTGAVDFGCEYVSVSYCEYVHMLKLL